MSSMFRRPPGGLSIMAGGMNNPGMPSVSPMRGPMPGGMPAPVSPQRFGPGAMPGGPAVSPMRGPMPGGPAVSPMRAPGGMVPGAVPQVSNPRMAIANALMGRR